MKIVMDDAMNVSVVYGRMPAAIKTTSDIMLDGDMGYSETGTQDPILSSWPFVIGVSAGTLAVSIILGILLAKLRIKKGFEPYED